MESHVKRCLQQHVLTWNPVSIGSEAWFDMELHVNSMMARSMSNAAFSTCLGVYHIDMGCHVKLMPPRTYNFDMKLHAKFDMGSMSNGLTRNFMSKVAFGARGNDLTWDPMSSEIDAFLTWDSMSMMISNGLTREFHVKRAYGNHSTSI